MNKMNYLELLPLSSITKYAKERPVGIAFTGYPRVHPSEKNKLILIYDPLSEHPVVLEFKFEDIQFVEELSSAVNEAGESILMVKLWVRRGASGMILEPFEVAEGAQLAGKIRAVKERVLQNPQAAQC
jgi:inorganic pyrophosphatase